MAGLTLRFFDEIQITHGTEPVEVSTRKAIAMLAYLAMKCQPHSRDSLTALLWPDTEQTRARANLRRLLWILNQTPVGLWLDATAESVFLKTDDLTVDTTQFTRLLQTAQDDVSLLSKAIDLYRGDFLADFHLYDNDEFESWVG